MIGIYKIENQLTKSVYIGQSICIEKRLVFHKSTYLNRKNKLYYIKLYRAFRQYGIENFTFSLVEECLPSDLDDREQYWIATYNSAQVGYNMTFGGVGVHLSGCRKAHHKLTDQDVFSIREEYSKHIPASVVFEKYKSKMSYSGFKKVFYGDNWVDVHYDVYTVENKAFFLKQKQARKGSQNPLAKLTEKDVLAIRQRKATGEKKRNVYQDYPIISWYHFGAIWSGKAWKHVTL